MARNDDDDEKQQAANDADFYRGQSSIWSDKVDEADDRAGRSQAERDHADSKYNYNRDD